MQHFHRDSADKSGPMENLRTLRDCWGLSRSASTSCHSILVMEQAQFPSIVVELSRRVPRSNPEILNYSANSNRVASP
jgi:hypothetical protein